MGSLYADIELTNTLDVGLAKSLLYCFCIYFAGDSEPLLWAIAKAELEVVILPLQQTMEVNPRHPDLSIFSLK